MSSQLRYFLQEHVQDLEAQLAELRHLVRQFQAGNGQLTDESLRAEIQADRQIYPCIRHLEWQVLQLSFLLLSVIFTPTSEALTVVSCGNL